jgi:hypothetical protein
LGLALGLELGLELELGSGDDNTTPYYFPLTLTLTLNPDPDPDPNPNPHPCTNPNSNSQVMGIWPKYADGTDINAIDVNPDLQIVATADDSGYLNILNFPSVVKEAPRKIYGGHSSFVQNVKFLPQSKEIR